MVSLSRTLLVALPFVLGVTAAPTDDYTLEYALEARQQQGNDSCVPASSIGTQAQCYEKCTDAIANFLKCSGVQACICNVLDTSLNVVDECVTCGAIFPLVHEFIENTIIKNLLSCDNYKPPQTPCETPSPTPSPPVCDAAAAFAADDPNIVTMCVADPATYTHNIGSLGVCITDCLYAVFRAKECKGLHTCVCSVLNDVVSSVSQCFKCGTLYDEIQGLVEALLIPTLLGCDLDPRPSTTYVICWSGTTTAVLPSGCTSIVPSGTSFATATATTAPAISSAPESSASATATLASGSSVESSASASSEASSSAPESSSPESSGASSTPESSSPSSSSGASSSGGLVPSPSGSCISSSDIGTQGDCYQKCTDAIATFLNCSGVQACICNVAEKSATIINECVTCGAVFPLVEKFIENTVIHNLLSCDNYKPPAQTPCETPSPTPSPPVCDAAAAFAADDPNIVTMCVADPATYTHNIGSLGVCITDCLYAIFRAKECNGLHECVCSVLNDVVSSVSQCFKCGTLYDEIQGLVETLLIPTLLGCDLDPRPSTTYVICWSDLTTAVLPSGCTSMVPSGTSLATATTSAATSGEEESSSGFATATFPSQSSGSGSGSATVTSNPGPAPETFTITTTDQGGETVTVTTCPVCEVSDVVIPTTVAPPKTETFTATDENGSTVIVTVCSKCTEEQQQPESTPVLTVTGESGSNIVVVPNPTVVSPETVTLTTTNQAGSTVVVTYCPQCESGSGGSGSNPGSGSGSNPGSGSGGSNPGSGSGGSSPGSGSGGSLPESGSGGSGGSGGSPGSGSGGSGGSGSSGSGGSSPGSGSGGSGGSLPESGSSGSGGSSPGSGSSGSSGSGGSGGSSPGSGSSSDSGSGSAPKPGNGILQANAGVALKPTMAAAAIIALVMMV